MYKLVVPVDDDCATVLATGNVTFKTHVGQYQIASFL